ncbi:MAG: selenide, water dikinase SelD [bacterium]|nr:selenide, water dikinase SelD [bacterium]
MTKTMAFPIRDGAGCSSKLAPAIVSEVLNKLKLGSPVDSYGAGRDDAAAILQEDGSWLILTVDNSPLTGETPFNCGKIAALNAMSDVWAMGGKPYLLAGTLIAGHELSKESIVEVLEGADAAVRAANAFYVTGQMNRHINNSISWLGFAVVGNVEKGRPLMQKQNLASGQVLVLTKRIGTGMLLAALERDLGGDFDFDAVFESMCESNRQASEILSRAGVEACTDVSGSGLGGSLAEMVKLSAVEATVFFDRVPLFRGSYEAASILHIRTGLNSSNEDWAEDLVKWDWERPRKHELRTLIFDPQTSGGLLAGVAEDQADGVLKELEEAGIPSSPIGRVESSGRSRITIR